MADGQLAGAHHGILRISLLFSCSVAKPGLLVRFTMERTIVISPEMRAGEHHGFGISRCGDGARDWWDFHGPYTGRSSWSSGPILTVVFWVSGKFSSTLATSEVVTA